MVPREISTEEPMAKPLEVDYDLNPTILYKLIESKKWNGVISRSKQEPSEAGTWISRSGKDGKLRWKILPLHAAICFKAPKVVLLKLLKAFPEGASSVDDQGMLPMHLALKNNKVDDTFLRALLNAYPRGIQRKDKKGRVPLEMKGEAIFDCWKLALDMERKKIRSEEKKLCETKLLSERGLIEERSKYFDETQAELIMCKEISEKLKHDCSAKDKEIEAQRSLILDVKEDLITQKIETKKHKLSVKLLKAQEETHEKKS